MPTDRWARATSSPSPPPCSACPAWWRMAVRRIKDELLPRYPNVDDVIGLEHTYGCGVAIDAPDAVIPIRTLRNISPQPELRRRGDGGEPRLREAAARPAAAAGIVSDRGRARRGLRAPRPICLQAEHHVGFLSMLDDIVASARPHLERLNARRRETVSGQRTGGRRAMRRQRRLLRRHGQPGGGLRRRPAGARRRHGDVQREHRGARRRGAAHQPRRHARRGAGHHARAGLVRPLPGARPASTAAPTPRPATRPAACRTSSRRRWARSSRAARRRSRTCCRRARSCEPGQRGLVFAATPASDFICGTLQLAAGMNLHVFTTGRGTPYGLAECPVIKVATRSDLARRWHDLMDVNAGQDRRRRGQHRGTRLGAVPPDAGGGQRPQADLGRALEAAQRAGAVQPGAGDLVSQERRPPAHITPRRRLPRASCARRGPSRSRAG